MKYEYIIIPIVALIICQIIKFLVEIILTKKISIKRLFSGSGGFPSSHTTFVSTLMYLIMFKEGPSSPTAALALVFALIVSYDAIGVRNESDVQARAINQLINKLKINHKPLDESIGHTLIEVIGGLILGFLVSSIYINFF